MEKKAVHGMVLILVLSSMLTLAFTVQPVKAVPITIWVPDDYLTIQEAVDAANNGDTIRVRAGTYDESHYWYGTHAGVLIRSKSISLVGEDASNTTITSTVIDTG